MAPARPVRVSRATSSQREAGSLMVGAHIVVLHAPVLGGDLLAARARPVRHPLGDLLTTRPRAAGSAGGPQGGRACLATHHSARQDVLPIHPRGLRPGEGMLLLSRWCVAHREFLLCS